MATRIRPPSPTIKRRSCNQQLSQPIKHHMNENNEDKPTEQQQPQQPPPSISSPTVSNRSQDRTLAASSGGDKPKIPPKPAPKLSSSVSSPVITMNANSSGSVASSSAGNTPTNPHVSSVLSPKGKRPMPNKPTAKTVEESTQLPSATIARPLPVIKTKSLSSSSGPVQNRRPLPTPTLSHRTSDEDQATPQATLSQQHQPASSASSAPSTPTFAKKGSSSVSSTLSLEESSTLSHVVHPAPSTTCGSPAGVRRPLPTPNINVTNSTANGATNSNSNSFIEIESVGTATPDNLRFKKPRLKNTQRKSVNGYDAMRIKQNNLPKQNSETITNHSNSANEQSNGLVKSASANIVPTSLATRRSPEKLNNVPILLNKNTKESRKSNTLEDPFDEAGERGSRRLRRASSIGSLVDIQNEARKSREEEFEVKRLEQMLNKNIQSLVQVDEIMSDDETNEDEPKLTKSNPLGHRAKRPPPPIIRRGPTAAQQPKQFTSSSSVHQMSSTSAISSNKKPNTGSRITSVIGKNNQYGQNNSLSKLIGIKEESIDISINKLEEGMTQATKATVESAGIAAKATMEGGKFLLSSAMEKGSGFYQLQKKKQFQKLVMDGFDESAENEEESNDLSQQTIKWMIEWFHDNKNPALRLAAARTLTKLAFPEERITNLRVDMMMDGGAAYMIDQARRGKLTVHRPITFDELLIKSEIAKGGSGIVYLGELDGHEVAIKQMSELSLCFSEEEFRTEVAIMSIIRHPNLLECLGAGKVVDKNMTMCYIVTPLQNAGTLKTVLLHSFHNLSLIAKLKIALGVARGVANLHKYNLLHRDLKSANVLLRKVNDDYHVAIADFGTSRAQTRHSVNVRMTKNVGSTAYMAPEVYAESGSEYTNKVDTYSFAILFAEILTGVSPFDGMRSFEIPFKVLQGERPILPKDVPEEIIDLIKHCWEGAPVARPDMESVCVRLNEIYQQQRSMKKS